MAGMCPNTPKQAKNGPKQAMESLCSSCKLKMDRGEVRAHPEVSLKQMKDPYVAGFVFQHTEISQKWHKMVQNRPKMAQKWPKN